MSSELLRITDTDGDQFVVSTSYFQPHARLFVSLNGEDAYLYVDEVKKLRKVLNKWLIDSGNKAA
jgi:hypothetical protein